MASFLRNFRMLHFAAIVAVATTASIVGCDTNDEVLNIETPEGNIEVEQEDDGSLNVDD